MSTRHGSHKNYAALDDYFYDAKRLIRIPNEAMLVTKGRLTLTCVFILIPVFAIGGRTCDLAS